MRSFWLLLALTWKQLVTGSPVDGQQWPIESSRLGRWGANVDTQRSLVTFERWITGASLGPQVRILGGIHLERRRITSFSIGKGVAHSDGGVNIPKWWGARECRAQGILVWMFVWFEMKFQWGCLISLIWNEMKWMGLVDLNSTCSLIWHESKATSMDCSDDDQKSLPKMWVPNVSWRHQSGIFFREAAESNVMMSCYAMLIGNRPVTNDLVETSAHLGDPQKPPWGSNLPEYSASHLFSPFSFALVSIRHWKVFLKSWNTPWCEKHSQSMLHWNLKKTSHVKQQSFWKSTHFRSTSQAFDTPGGPDRGRHGHCRYQGCWSGSGKRFGSWTRESWSGGRSCGRCRFEGGVQNLWHGENLNNEKWWSWWRLCSWRGCRRVIWMKILIIIITIIIYDFTYLSTSASWKNAYNIVAFIRSLTPWLVWLTHDLSCWFTTPRINFVVTDPYCTSFLG